MHSHGRSRRHRDTAFKLAGAAVVFLATGTAPATAQQAVSFTAVQPELFSAPGALVNAWADFDGDGDPDLFTGFNGNLPNRLYRNDAGRFVDVAAEAGIADRLRTRSAAWGDIDGDGDPDLMLGFARDDGPVTMLYRNDAGRFTDISAAAGVSYRSGATRQFVFVDVDGDGDLDLFLALRDGPNRLLLNDGRGRFSDGSGRSGLADGRRSVGAVWLDYDGDGDLDLYVANMDGDANGLFRNDGGRFTDVAEDAGVAWGGRAPGDPANGTVRPCVADVDGDGLLDLFAANYGPNGLFLNRGDGRFRDASDAWGVAVDGRYDSCAFADIDHDGDLDLFVNGTITGGVQYPDALYVNEGDRFVDVTPASLRALHADHGVQWADADGDGDLDLALAGAELEAGSHALLRNELPEDRRRSLQVLVVDGEGHATRAGAEVRLYDTATGRLLGTRLVDTGAGYDSQSVLPVHFGLPHPGPVDVVVTFPAGGTPITTRLEDVDPRAHQGTPVVVRVGGPGR